MATKFIDIPNLSMFLKTRKEIIQKNNYKCKKCSVDGKMLSSNFFHIHHIDEDRTNNKKENLLLLCRECHRSLHEELNNGVIKNQFGAFKRIKTNSY